jgi:hypothetical protein
MTFGSLFSGIGGLRNMRNRKRAHHLIFNVRSSVP